MLKRAFFFLFLMLGGTLTGAESTPAAAEDPLLSPAMVLCLRPLRLVDEPAMSHAVETVKRLTSFSQSQTGNGRKAVDALIFIFKDLFLKEQEYAAAQRALNIAERQAVSKEQLAVQTETVGSPLSGPNPRLASAYRKEAADLRGKATRVRDAALKLLKEKIIAYNVSVSYFKNQGYNEVVIVLASSIFAIVDRQLPGFEFTPAVSREWVEKQRRV